MRIENVYEIGRSKVICTDHFKTENQEDLKAIINNAIAQLICKCESNEIITFSLN